MNFFHTLSPAVHKIIRLTNGETKKIALAVALTCGVIIKIEFTWRPVPRAQSQSFFSINCHKAKA